MNKTLLFLALLIIGTYSISAQTIRLIVVSDIEDIEFGLTSIRDGEQMLQMANTMKEHLEYKLETTFLEKDNFNTNSVRNVLKKLKSDRKDIILFYYSGKGVYPANSQSKFPFLKLKNAERNPISLDEIAAIIDSKKEALGIVMADCRDTEPHGLATDASFDVSEDWIDKLVVQKIFLGTCGVVKIASSSKGQPTYTTRGASASAYTTGFTRTFQNLLGAVSINQLDNVSLQTLMNSGSHGPRLEGGEKAQESVVEILPCRETRRNVATKFPSYANVLSYRELSRSSNRLIDTQPPSERKKIIDELKRGFTPDATVTIKRIKEGSRTPFSTREMPIANYWIELGKFNAELLDLRFLSDSIIRTSDYTKIAILEVQEMWK